MLAIIVNSPVYKDKDIANLGIFTIWSSQEKVFFCGPVIFSVGNNFEIVWNNFVFLGGRFIRIL